MATRQGLIKVEFETTPALLAAMSHVFEECLDRECTDIDVEDVADLKARVEGLEWAPPDDRHIALTRIAAFALCALAAFYGGDQ